MLSVFFGCGTIYWNAVNLPGTIIPKRKLTIPPVESINSPIVLIILKSNLQSVRQKSNQMSYLSVKPGNCSKDRNGKIRSVCTTVVQLTNHSLDLRLWKQAWCWNFGIEPMLAELIGPRDEPITIILLNGHSNKFSLNSYLYYSQMNVFFKHQRISLSSWWLLTQIQTLTTEQNPGNKQMWRAL